MNRRTHFSKSPLVIAMFACSVANANPLSQDPVLNISDVIVVNGEKPSAIQNATTHWQITAEEIQASGAVSLDQVLKNVPGLYVRVGGVGTPRIDIRGLKTRHIVYLVNGVPANNTNDGQFDPSVVPSSQIEAVEVSVGPTSVLYGPGGAGGVINIITKSGATAPGIAGRVEGSEQGTLNADVSVAGGGDNWQGMLSLSHQKKDSFPLSDDYPEAKYQSDDSRDNSDKEVQTLYGQGSYYIDENSVITANMSIKTGEWGKPGLDGSSSKKTKFERVDDYDEKTLQLGGAHTLNPALTVRGFGYYNQSDVVEYSYDDETFAQITEQLDGQSTVQGVNIQTIMELSEQSLFTTAVIAENQTWESQEQTKKASSERDDDLWLYTLASEYQYQANADYGASLGGAYHYLDKEEDEESDLSAQGSVYWWATDASKWALGYAHKVRYPSMRNLYSLSSGNEELTPETSNHYELSLTQQLANDTELLIAGHHSVADDYIAKDGDGIYQNLGDYRFQGVDVAIDSRYWDSLGINVSYSYLDTKDKEAKSGQSRLEHRPRHQLRVQATYEFATGTAFNLNIERIMGQIFYGKQKVDGKNVTQQVKLNDYTLVDANVSQQIFNENLAVYVRATNLLDENYYQSEALPQAGRQVFLGINWQL